MDSRRTDADWPVVISQNTENRKGDFRKWYVQKVLGKLSTFNVNGKTVDYVDIDWDDAF